MSRALKRDDYGAAVRALNGAVHDLETSRKIVGKLVGRSIATVQAGRGPLTRAEVAILLAAASGEDAPESARRLMRSVETIKAHRGGVLRKLGARNMAHAVAIAYRSGLIDDVDLEQPPPGY